MSRPSPSPAHDGLARKIRENCARMLADAETAGLLTPLVLLFIQEVTRLFLQLADLLERFHADALPAPAAPRRRAARKLTPENRAKPRPRPAREPQAAHPRLARPRPRPGAPRPRPAPQVRTVERYPKP